MYLQENSALYKDIAIVLYNTPDDSLSLSSEKDNDKIFKTSNYLKENENPLDLHRFHSQETIIILNVSASKEISIAPDEVKPSETETNS